MNNIANYNSSTSLTGKSKKKTAARSIISHTYIPCSSTAAAAAAEQRGSSENRGKVSYVRVWSTAPLFRSSWTVQVCIVDQIPYTLVNGVQGRRCTKYTLALAHGTHPTPLVIVRQHAQRSGSCSALVSWWIWCYLKAVMQVRCREVAKIFFAVALPTVRVIHSSCAVSIEQYTSTRVLTRHGRRAATARSYSRYSSIRDWGSWLRPEEQEASTEKIDHTGRRGLVAKQSVWSRTQSGGRRVLFTTTRQSHTHTLYIIQQYRVALSTLQYNVSFWALLFPALLSDQDTKKIQNSTPKTLHSVGYHIIPPAKLVERSTSSLSARPAVQEVEIRVGDDSCVTK